MWYQIKAMCLNKLFCFYLSYHILFQMWSWYNKNWGYSEIVFRRYTTNSHRVPSKPIHFCLCIFLSQMYTLISPNMESWDLDLSDDMCFVKIIKSFDSIRS